MLDKYISTRQALKLIDLTTKKEKKMSVDHVIFVGMNIYTSSSCFTNQDQCA